MSEVRQALQLSLFGHEGEVLRVYDDATGRTLNKGDTIKGYATIGVGRNLMGRGISQRESRFMLENDIDEVEKELDRHLPVWRTFAPGRQLAVLELAFNMGAVNFVFGWPNTVRAMKAEQWQLVEKAIAESKWRKDVGETRSANVRRLILTGRIA